jgi:hypothetical protein
MMVYIHTPMCLHVSVNCEEFAIVSDKKKVSNEMNVLCYRYVSYVHYLRTICYLGDDNQILNQT